MSTKELREAAVAKQVFNTNDEEVLDQLKATRVASTYF
jgi:hypothetical protein